MKKLITLTMLILIGSIAFVTLALADTTIDIRLTSNSVATLEDGSLVLAGRDANASPTDSTLVALVCCISPTGELLWRYEVGDPGTRNDIYDVSISANGEIQALQMELDSDMGRKQYLLRLRDGELISRIELEPSTNQLTAAGENLLVQTTASSETSDAGYNQYYHTLTLFTHDLEEIWRNTYDRPFSLTGILPLNGDYVLFGSIQAEDGNFQQYIAYLDKNGRMIWRHTTPYANARYFDAVAAENGDIVVVGGIYAAGDGSSYPLAQIACYSSSGELRWEHEQRYDELGILFDTIVKVPEGYLAAGANSMLDQTVRIVYYDSNGNVVFAWDEPLDEGFHYAEYVDLLRIGDDVYLVVTADYRKESENMSAGHLVYQTLVKNIHYLSPL